MATVSIFSQELREDMTLSLLASLPTMSQLCVPTSSLQYCTGHILNMVLRWSTPILRQPLEIVRKKGETPFSQSVLREKTTLVSLQGNNLEFSAGLID